MDAQILVGAGGLLSGLSMFLGSLWTIHKATKKINGTPERVQRLEHHMRAVRNITDVMLELEEHRMEDAPDTPANARLIAKLIRTRESLRELS